MAGRGASRVPERWTEYTPLGCRMPGTRFIAFKVPLKKSFDQNLLPEERFSPGDLLRKVEELQEELGLIIDLTYTTRYYGREELPPTLRYSKILTMGHEIPNRKTILRFKYLVKKFLMHNKDNDKLIGVHCTHGLNRTGYLVCRYLIDVEGMEPNAAIELFNKSRGHPIERTNYIQDLQKRALKSCEVKNSGSDVIRKKGSAPAKPQKQLVKQQQHQSQAPLAVPRTGSTKKKQRPDPRAQEQPWELGHRHRALGQRQLEQKQVKKLQQGQLEQRQQKHVEQRQLEQKKLEQRQQKKLKHLEQNHLEQNYLEQQQQKKLKQKQQKKLKHLEQNHLEQNYLEQRQQKLEQKQHNHVEQRQQKKLKHLEQNHLEQSQNHLEQNHLEQKQQNYLEQRQQKKMKHLEQRQNHLEHNHLEQNNLEQRKQKKVEQKQHNHVEQKQQKKLKHLEQNHLEQNHLEQRQQKKLEQKQHNHVEQRQQKKLKHLEQNHLEQSQNHLEQNHVEQRQQKKQKHLEQSHLEHRQPCSWAPRNCWLSPAPRKKHKGLFPGQSPQGWLPQEPSPARKRRRHELREQEMS